MRSLPTRLVRSTAASLFGGLARARGGRPLHPSGVAFEGELVVDGSPLPEAELFAGPGRRRAVVRFSRGFGVPEPLPEILSVAVKVPDAYGPGRDHDLMLTATGSPPGLRHVFLAGRSHLARVYSSVLPFTVGDETVVLGAAPRTAPRGAARGLEELAEAAAAGELVLELRVARATGRWRPIGRVVLRRRLGEDEEDALSFSSSNTGGGIAPAGFVNDVRDAAYAAAARGRRA